MIQGTTAACIVAYNNESTIGMAVNSLHSQSIPVVDVFVVDDGSSDSTARETERAGARVVSLDTNQGRGAARARAIEESSAEFLLSVDGTATLAPDFLERTLPWFEDPQVAAVYGRIDQKLPKSAIDRWRGRHLYKLHEHHEPCHMTSLTTGGFVARRTAIVEVGSFDRNLRHSEDCELGKRLLAAQWKIGYEPRARLTTQVSNSIGQVFERYWRWNQAAGGRFVLRESIRFTWYSVKVMAKLDLQSGDLAGAGITLLLPYYCAWRSLRSK